MPITYKRTLDGVDWSALKASLQADDFDNGRSPEQLARSFAQSYGVCFACDGDQIVGKARVLSDGVCNAYIVDVWTLSAYRHQGIASTLIKHLLADVHGQHVYLFTDDAMEFYRTLGFREQPTGMSLVVGTWLDHQPEQP